MTQIPISECLCFILFFTLVGTVAFSQQSKRDNAVEYSRNPCITNLPNYFHLGTYFYLKFDTSLILDL